MYSVSFLFVLVNSRFLNQGLRILSEIHMAKYDLKVHSQSNRSSRKSVLLLSFAADMHLQRSITPSFGTVFGRR